MSYVTGITSFQTAENHLAHGRNKSSRTLGGHGGSTLLVRLSDDQIAVRLHGSDVVIFNRDGSTVVSSCGWKTITTKDRINTHARLNIGSDKGIWYHYPNGWSLINRIPFADGMIVHADGTITGFAEDPREELTLRRVVKRYAKNFAQALKSGQIDPPSNGDCWFCCLVDVHSKKPLGEVTRDHSHIREHIREGYYVPSLLVNALKEFGASKALTGFVGERLHDYPRDKGWTSFFADRGFSDVEKYVKRYCFRRLGLAD